jgi:hypothetical protein
MYQQARLVIYCDEKTGVQAVGHHHVMELAKASKPASLLAKNWSSRNGSLWVE